ncbi:MAG: hypothetical protein HFJ50_04905 [Clostridia bacterium]|jgi:hypothetical protein|nr:hypothetical protein [Clostridia bacterium]
MNFADVNKDGFIDVEDARKILLYIARTRCNLKEEKEMKNLKRIIVLAIFLTMIGLIFACNICNAEVDDVKGKLKIDDINGKTGENINLKILVQEDMEIDNDGLLLEFNKEKLQYIKSSVATVPNAIIVGGNRENHPAGPDGFSIAITSSIEGKAKISAGTEIANITFKILENTETDEILTLVHYKGNTKTTIAQGKVLINKENDETQEPSNPTPTPAPTDTPEPSPEPTQKPDASEPNKVVHEMIEGKESVWQNGKGKNLVFRSNANFADFVNVLIDNNVLDSKYYIAKSGSTLIEIKEEYLKTLKVGTHTITINSKTGSANANFKVEQSVENKPVELPKTGNTFVTVITIIFGILLINILITLLMYRKIK